MRAIDSNEDSIRRRYSIGLPVVPYPGKKYCVKSKYATGGDSPWVGAMHCYSPNQNEIDWETFAWKEPVAFGLGECGWSPIWEFEFVSANTDLTSDQLVFIKIDGQFLTSPDSVGEELTLEQNYDPVASRWWIRSRPSDQLQTELRCSDNNTNRALVLRFAKQSFPLYLMDIPIDPNQDVDLLSYFEFYEAQ